MNQRLEQRQASIVTAYELLQGCQAASMLTVRSLVERAAPSNCIVLIEGETGVGKEVVAQAIHDLSSRTKQPFVVVDCTALNQELVLSELFGHEAGAFTGAIGHHRGFFEVADEGTIFLDELSQLSLPLQSKILRVLDTGRFTRVGGTGETRVDVRVIAASNTNLATMVANQKFRDDLFYRLNVFPIYVPPLRKRREDILSLAKYFLRELSGNGHRFAPNVETLLSDCLWPGNVWQLKNAVERAILLADESETIQTYHLTGAFSNVSELAGEVVNFAYCREAVQGAKHSP